MVPSIAAHCAHSMPTVVKSYSSSGPTDRSCHLFCTFTIRCGWWINVAYKCHVEGTTHSCDSKGRLHPQPHGSTRGKCNEERCAEAENSHSGMKTVLPMFWHLKILARGHDLMEKEQNFASPCISPEMVRSNPLAFPRQS